MSKQQKLKDFGVSLLILSIIFLIPFGKSSYMETCGSCDWRFFDIDGETSNFSTTGNVSASYFVGSGTLLTGITADNVADIFINDSGDTMTGNLIMNANITSGLNNITLDRDVVITGTLYGGSPLKIGSLINATANISSPFFKGDGSELTNINASLLVGLNESQSLIDTFVEAAGDTMTGNLNNTKNITVDGYVGIGGPTNTISTDRILTVAGDLEVDDLILRDETTIIKFEDTGTGHDDFRFRVNADEWKLQQNLNDAGSWRDRITINNTDIILGNRSGGEIIKVGVLGDFDIGGNYSGNNIYGEMWNYSSGGWSFPIASSGVYYNLTNFVDGDLHGFVTTHNAEAAGGSYMTAIEPGKYTAMLSFSFAGGNNQLYGISITKNHDHTLTRDCYARRITTTTATASASVSCIVDLAAGDTINVKVEDEAGVTAAVTVYQVNLNLVRVGR